MIRPRAACRAFTIPRLSGKRLCGPVFFNAHTKDIIIDAQEFVKSEKRAFGPIFPVDTGRFPLYNDFIKNKNKEAFAYEYSYDCGPSG